MAKRGIMESEDEHVEAQVHSESSLADLSDTVLRGDNGQREAGDGTMSRVSTIYKYVSTVSNDPAFPTSERRRTIAPAATACAHAVTNITPSRPATVVHGPASASTSLPASSRIAVSALCNTAEDAKVELHQGWTAAAGGHAAEPAPPHKEVLHRTTRTTGPPMESSSRSTGALVGAEETPGTSTTSLPAQSGEVELSCRTSLEHASRATLVTPPWHGASTSLRGPSNSSPPSEEELPAEREEARAQHQPSHFHPMTLSQRLAQLRPEVRSPWNADDDLEGGRRGSRRVVAGAYQMGEADMDGKWGAPSQDEDDDDDMGDELHDGDFSTGENMKAAGMEVDELDSDDHGEERRDVWEEEDGRYDELQSVHTDDGEDEVVFLWERKRIQGAEETMEDAAAGDHLQEERDVEEGEGEGEGEGEANDAVWGEYRGGEDGDSVGMDCSSDEGDLDMMASLMMR
ncbi:hypothetical protein IAT38_003574 [Cryptococcus sp. DSM 104549]